MKRALKKLALIGLLLTVLPPALLFAGATSSLSTVHHLMFAGMLLWFLSAIPWLAFPQKPNS